MTLLTCSEIPIVPELRNIKQNRFSLGCVICRRRMFALPPKFQAINLRRIWASLEDFTTNPEAIGMTVVLTQSHRPYITISNTLKTLWTERRIYQKIFTVRKRSCGKVMFSEVFVCPQGERSLSLVRCSSWEGGSPWQRTPWTETPRTVKNGRYASYCNAFLC